MSRSPTCWRNTPGAIRTRPPSSIWNPAPPIDFGQLDRVADRHRGLSQEQGHQQGQPRPGAVRRMPGKAADLVRRLADRRGDLPVQSRDQRKADGRADRGAQARADPLSQGDRRRGDGRRRAGRRACASAHGRRTARTTRRTSCSLRCRAATRRTCPSATTPTDTACIFCTSGTTARPKIVIYNHAAYWMNGLDTLEFLGLTEDDRTLEYRSFGWNSAQVLSLLPFLQKGLTHAHRQAILAQPFLRMGAAARHHLLGRRADRAQHAAEQAARLHRQGHADAAADELLDRAADRAAMDAVRGDVRRHAAADVRHVGDRLDLRQPALRQEDGHGRPAGAASGAGDRRRRRQRMPAGRRGRDHRRRPADGDRLPARRRLDRSGAAASASRPATSASRTPKASCASPAAART